MCQVGKLIYFIKVRSIIIRIKAVMRIFYKYIKLSIFVCRPFVKGGYTIVVYILLIVQQNIATIVLAIPQILFLSKNAIFDCLVNSIKSNKMHKIKYLQ